MSRVVTVSLDLDTLPAAIAESITTTLRPHRVGLEQRDVDGASAGRLDPKKLGEVLRELGNNIAAMVVLTGEDALEQAFVARATAPAAVTETARIASIISIAHELGVFSHAIISPGRLNLTVKGRDHVNVMYERLLELGATLLQRDHGPEREGNRLRQYIAACVHLDQIEVRVTSEHEDADPIRAIGGAA